MGKLKLNLDDLKVESFATTPELTNGRGTVFAQATVDTADCGATCNGSCVTNCIGCGGSDPNFCESAACSQEGSCYPQQTCAEGCTFGTCYDTCNSCPGNTCQNTCANTCDDLSCAGTCYETCADTCLDTCNGCTAPGAAC